MRRLVMAIALASTFPAAAAADVTLRIEWAIAGPLPDLVAAVKEGHALQKKLVPAAEHELWVNLLHGANVGRASLIVRYADLQHFAEADSIETESDEWAAFLAGFPAEAFPTTFVGLSDLVIDHGAGAAQGGEVQEVIGFELRAGLAGLTALVEQARALHAQMNRKSRIGLVARAYRWWCAVSQNNA